MKLAEAINVTPSPRQLAWQQLGFYGFIHFGMNTMTDREWGDGTEDPALFAPTGLDEAAADRAVAAMQAAHMRGLILTCKHHDGFCLWPTKTTTHSVAASPWQNGHGDVVRLFADACARHQMQFGVYLSPWDRNAAVYGQGKAYDDLYVAQLTELLSNYGPLFEIWLDGANGEGPNGKHQVYDWDRYYQVMRTLQPNAVIAVSGPDVRWIGNEAGHIRPSEWSVVPAALREAERVAALSQQSDDAAFSRQFKSTDDDLGSRDALADYDGPLVWYPAEVDTSIRPGWFFHEAQDTQVRSGEALFDLYCKAVGGNAALLLNVPLDRCGRFGAADQAALVAVGQKIIQLTDTDVSGAAVVAATSAVAPFAITGGASEAPAATMGDAGETLALQSAWEAAPDDATPTVTLTWAQPVCVNTLILREAISRGQRVEAFSVMALQADGWHALTRATTIGNCRILRFEEVETTALKITFTGFRAAPTLAEVRVARLEGVEARV
ncbi:alpha-L-fucosidase [Lacticaseibacillus yichunensis]|uniref:alpha-L-fucosidase n=1 Tax=Lacticaseibacillus yichunensis TaxID=2486015 RepID=A0ABW4CQW0_9LACO|nr:alpha-L-fucosidase [Lacticaseibacillus yichunensis]